MKRKNKKKQYSKPQGKNTNSHIRKIHYNTIRALIITVRVRKLWNNIFQALSTEIIIPRRVIS